jgi:hypothetical protein
LILLEFDVHAVTLSVPAAMIHMNFRLIQWVAVTLFIYQLTRKYKTKPNPNSNVLYNKWHLTVGS